MRPDLLSFDDPFRPAYERYAVYAWLGSILISGIAILVSPVPTVVFAINCAIAFPMMYKRVKEMKKIEQRQKDMEGTPLSFMTRDELAVITNANPDKIFLGYGFPWSREEAQVAHTLKRYDPERLYPRDADDLGQRWIHGLGKANEQEIFIPFSHLGGMSFILGTTGSGKTRMLDTIVTQAIAKGIPVILIDPKADTDIWETIQAACKAYGRENDLRYFHPAHPEKSTRLDPMKNFNRGSELATRIATLLQKGSQIDTFVNFGQMAMNTLCAGMLMIDEKPTILKLRSLLENGFDGLMKKCLEHHFNAAMGEKWREDIKPFIKEGQGSPTKLLAANIQFYRARVKAIKSSSEVEGLISAYEHDRDHASKLLASLMPVLTQLTAGPMGPLLSPDYEDAKDTRPITDFEKVVRNNQVLYIALDSLSDSMVASAMGALFLTDLASMAAARYNFKKKEELTPWMLIVDEAAEVACTPLLQILNKSRGSGGNAYLCTQTVPDFAAKTGSKDDAMQMLGNLNNVYSLRVTDTDTQEYVAAKMLDTVVRTVQVGQSVKTETDQPIVFSSTISESIAEETIPLVPGPMLNCLPNLEFFAMISAGRVLKCRIPILVESKRGVA